MGPRDNEYAWDNSTAISATVTAASAQVLPYNKLRRYAVFTNTGGGSVSLNVNGAAVAGAGVTINSGGGVWELNCTNLTHGAIAAVSAAGSTLSILEGY